MAATSVTLASVLSPYVKTGYKTLFTSEGGFLQFRDNMWSVSRASPKDLPEYYSSLADTLVKSESGFEEVPNLDEFVSQFNSRRTLVLYPKPPVANAGSTFIYFNSKSPGGSNFLSNFFETLVPFRSHNNPRQIALYRSSENAYQAHKLTALARQDDEDLLERAEWIESIAIASPSDAKKLSQQASYEPLTTESARMKASLMTDILFAKFRSNPVILVWLKRTGTKDLVEDTSDSFWGSKDPRDPVLQKSYRKEIDEASRNVLGRILVAIRTELCR